MHFNLELADYTASVTSNLIELFGLIPNQVLRDLDKIRGFRNDIVHSNEHSPKAKDAELALETTQWMIKRHWDFEFEVTMSYSFLHL
jgi:hypothetical protein